MKKLLLTSLLAGLAAVAYGQGQIALDNINNTGAGPTATSGGLFFTQTGAAAPVLISGDFNAAFYGGTDSTALSLIKSFSGATAVGTGSAGAGTFFDPTGNTYPVPGTTGSSTTAFFQIEAWTGNFSSYALALASGTALTAKSLPFGNAVSSGTANPVDLVSMPSLILTAIPEPSTFALGGLGAAALLIFRRRRK